MSDKAVTLSKDDLKEILETVVTAARQPVMTDSEKARIAGEQEERVKNAEMVKRQMEARYRAQEICTHIRRDGTTLCVPFHDDGGDALICQKCQGIIRNGHKPAGYDGTDHFNPELFTRLFQMAQPEIFG